MRFPGLRSITHLRHKPSLSNGNRASFKSAQWEGIRVLFLRQIIIGGIAFMLWFLACCSYLFGGLYRNSSRHAHIKILAVDYDGGVVGAAMNGAYQQLKAPDFFTLEYGIPGDYPTEADAFHAVWEGHYWGAIVVTPGASARLEGAIQGVNASRYNPADALHYIWNQQRYTTYSESIVQSSMQQLVALTRVVYNKINGTQALQSLNRNDPDAVEAFLNPISSTASDIQPAEFGSVILINTISMVMPILQQFFFLLVINGAMRQHHLYHKMTVRSSLLLRRIAGFIFTFGAALCQTGYLWAFKENWHVNGNQFVLTWMTYWLLMSIHYLVLDTASTISPLPAMPFVVLFWIFVNLGSTISPLELQPGFFHWGIALPSHNAYLTFITIWTGGADNRLYRTLPVMFAWWIVSNITTSLAHYRACHLAYMVEHKGASAEQETKMKDEEVESSDNTPSSGVQVQWDFEDAAREQREVYGPGIPPF